jgi:hypothetical protein
VNRIFILSPARTSGERADLIYNPGARFDLARRLHRGEALPLREIMAFLSGLYFRGKVAYAKTFGTPLNGMAGALVITSNAGLLDVDQPLTLAELRAFSTSEIDLKNSAYVAPLVRDAKRLARKLGPEAEVVLLGSISTKKYVEPLAKIFGQRLKFPVEFVGRGDMSRGSLLLRSAVAKTELTYTPLAGATLHGKRPPRLEPRRWKREELRVWFDSCLKAIDTSPANLTKTSRSRA